MSENTAVTESTESKLDRLAIVEQARAKRLAELDAEKQALKDSIMTDELKASLREIDEEFAPSYQKLDEEIADPTALRSEIIDETRSLQKSVKGQWLQAVYSKSRVTWDTAGLDGYLVAHPEIAKFRKVGKDSVSIQEIK